MWKTIIYSLFFPFLAWGQPGMLLQTDTSYSGMTPVTIIASPGVDVPLFQIDTNVIVTADGAWTWFNDPRAFVDTVTDQTIIGYVSSTGEIGISKYPLRDSITIGNTTADDHSNPAIIRKSDGKYLAVYSEHNDTTFVVESSAVSDITAFTRRDTLLGALAYAQLFELPNEGRIMLMYRKDVGNRYIRFSDDGGLTWGAERLFFSGPGRPYVIGRQKNADRIDFFGTQAHPETAVVTNTYHWYYQDSAFYNTDGTLISSDTVGLSNTDATLVDSTGHDLWVWDIAWTDAGNPIVAYAEIRAYTDHRYRFARWNGSAWVAEEIFSAGSGLYGTQPYYSPGVSIIDENTVITSRADAGNLYSIFLGYKDGGTWRDFRLTVTRATNGVHIRPFVPRGATWESDFQFLYLDGTYSTFNAYNTIVRGVKIIDNREP